MTYAILRRFFGAATPSSSSAAGARSKIREYFKKNEQEENHKIGILQTLLKPKQTKKHERQYPKETYVADNNVALSVSKARSALILGQEYLGWVEGRRKYSDIN